MATSDEEKAKQFYDLLKQAPNGTLAKAKVSKALGFASPPDFNKWAYKSLALQKLGIKTEGDGNWSLPSQPSLPIPLASQVQSRNESSDLNSALSNASTSSVAGNGLPSFRFGRLTTLGDRFGVIYDQSGFVAPAFHVFFADGQFWTLQRVPEEQSSTLSSYMTQSLNITQGSSTAFSNSQNSYYSASNASHDSASAHFIPSPVAVNSSIAAQSQHSNPRPPLQFPGDAALNESFR